LGGGFLADLAFSPDGDRIVAGGLAATGGLKLVNRNGRRLLEAPPLGQGEAIVWHWRVPRAPGDLLTGETVRGVGFDPDGRHVALGELDGKVRLWAGTNGAQPVLLPGRPGPALQSVAFGDGGRTLFSADAGGRVRAWTLTGRPKQLVLRRQP